MKRESIVYGQHSKNFLNGVASQLMFLEVEVDPAKHAAVFIPPPARGNEVKGLLLVMVSQV